MLWRLRWEADGFKRTRRHVSALTGTHRSICTWETVCGLHRNKASVYRKHCNRYHPAWSDGRLCDTYDYKIQKEQIHGNGETASDHKGSSRLNDVDHCQCTLLLRSNIRCRTLFKHRHDKLYLYTSCKRRNYQYVCSYTGITFNVHDI